MKIREIAMKNFIVCDIFASVASCLEEVNISNACYILLEENKYRKKVLRANRLLSVSDVSAPMANLTGDVKFSELSEHDDLLALFKVDDEVALVIDARDRPFGIIDNLPQAKRLLQYCRTWDGNQGLDYHEFENIIQVLDVDIFVTDGRGYILFLNPAAEKVCGFKQADVIGKHVTDLEKDQLISRSITMEVIKNRKKVNILQRMNTGKTVLSSAIPIFNASGELTRVLSTSNNVAEINNLLNKLKEKDQELVAKNQQIDLMREALFGQNNFACFTGGLEEIKDSVMKIAPTDLTVLIQGESGVGKEVVAKLLHNLSSRNKYPLIKINCGLIPENLIESELFGYEGGAFTGASRDGKIGKIEMADQGTLFLDEIGEMPLLLQVKLLEFLQDREITRVGGTKRIRVNTRIIAATNRDLKEMVRKGAFREDLYYRLNVFPLYITPLRSRKDDILSLVEYFVGKFNDKYKVNKSLSVDALDFLMNYDWPGNIRELESAIERVIVNSNTDLIGLDEISVINNNSPRMESRINCSGIMPWKEAKKELERQLVKRAYEQYKSTYKAAEALNVSQSTVAKIIKRLNK